MTIRSIVCGVDFSPASRKALRVAIDLARAHRSRLTVVFADDPVLVAAARAARDPRGTRTRATAALERFIARTARRRLTAHRLHGVVTEGTPADELTKAARRERADVIVVGTRGAGNVARMLLGSTAHRVLQSARVPVLAVPWGGSR